MGEGTKHLVCCAARIPTVLQGYHQLHSWHAPVSEEAHNCQPTITHPVSPLPPPPLLLRAEACLLKPLLLPVLDMRGVGGTE